MKRTLFNIFAVLALLVSLVNVVQPVAASRWAQEIQAAQSPTAISYQGLVKVNGQPFSGTGYFKFAIVNADGSISRWSNDGSSTGGGEPTNPVPLPVSEGLFSVLLGDTSLSGMTRVIDAQTMWVAGKTCRLRVWFSPDGVTAYTLLSPDRPFASAPFALVADYASDANTLAGHATSFFQQRISGACAAGSTVQSVAADGTVTCLPLQPKPGLSITYLDTVNNVGWYSSTAIGVDGLPLISYYDATSFNLKVAHCNDLACTTATISVLDSAGSTGTYTAITIGGDGLGLISYRDYTNQSLKVAHCSDIVCSTATLSTLDNISNTGTYTSITSDYQGRGIISYIDQTNNDLKVASCNNDVCSSAIIYTLDSDLASEWTSITLTVAKAPIISYHDGTGNLNVAYCQGSSCSSVTLYTIDSSVNAGQYSSITIGTDGLPIISYYDSTNKDLKIAHCSNAVCSSASTSTLYDYEDSGKYNSIIIGSDGLPVIAFNTFSSTSGHGFLKLVHCSTFACDQYKIMDLDSDQANTGMYTSVAIGVDGMPIISYYEEEPGDLLVLHCANRLCDSYRRGR